MHLPTPLNINSTQIRDFSIFVDIYTRIEVLPYAFLTTSNAFAAMLPFRARASSALVDTAYTKRLR